MSTPETLHPVDHRSAWRADLHSRDSFTVSLQSRHIEAFEAAVAAARTQVDAAESITRDLFALEAIADDIAGWRDEVMHGSGLVILSRLPVERLDKDELGMIHFGLGTYLGTAMSQSVMGDRLGHVVDVGGKDPRERAYRNSTELDMHTDACDLVAMMCLQKARSGGLSGYVSAISIYNEILSRRPDLMPALMAGFRYHRFGEQAPGEAPVTEDPIPVFSFRDDILSVNYLRSYIEMGAEELGQQLTAQQVEALDLVDEIATDPKLALQFVTEPGEIVIFNNLTVLHNRTAFEDAPEPELKRHLLRLWLVAHDPRPVADTLRIYEGRGIAEQAGKSTYFEGNLAYSRFDDDDDVRM
ncbi:MAG: TauD/TfdA family dioxygenase [Gammaproteobacteria bacterium]|nr:TauD/TfdA family dioxygenase [Gammaproteobacteria bacterium]